jgi:endonuclease/exonuclease/phosphatase (EEP) superfamily protein YafD
VSVLGWLAVLAAALPTFTRPLARLDWRLDLLTHFQVAHATFSAILAAILWRIRRKPAFVALFLAVVQVAPLVRYYWPNPVPPASGSSGKLRLVVLNVLVDNLNHQAVRELLTHEDPDLIGLIEYTPLWKSALEPVSRLYPFRFEAPDGPQGLALWSRVPLIEPRVERHTGTGWPCIHTRIEFAGQTVNVWLAHPSSPVRRMRDGGFPELAALGARVASVSGPRLVVGDLNTTSGSPLFGDFLRSSGLRDSRLGFGLQGSWPSPLPYRIAIDHALLSPELAVASRRIGPDVGSDHRPLILELAPSRAIRHTSTTESASDP